MAVKKDGVSIQQLLTLLSKGGGIASSNTFKVTFEEHQRSANKVNHKLLEGLRKTISPSFSIGQLAGDTIGNANPGNYISLMCDDVSLPGVQAGTGQINGMYTGSGTYNYAHTRIFNDLTMSWICDANMTPLKFLQSWMDSIFVEEDGGGIRKTILQTGPSNVKERDRSRSVRLNYLDEYTLQVSILKAEKGNKSELGRPSIRYVCEGVFPYAIDSIPVSYGSTQLVKVSANFYYERWYTYYTNQWNKQGPNIG